MLALALCAAACQSGFGMGPPEPPTPFQQQYIDQFNAIDTQKKGVITMDQAVEHYGRKFGELDTNRDGMLDANELTPFAPVMNAKTGPAIVEALDRNGDAKISRQEFQVIVNWLFQRASGSNQMTLSEAATGTYRAPPGAKTREMPTDRLPDNR